MVSDADTGARKTFPRRRPETMYLGKRSEKEVHHALRDRE
jgi:hypothetical protein